MLEVSFWVKGGRERETEVLSYEDALAVVCRANYVSVIEAEHYLERLKEQMEDDEECGLEYLIEKLKKLTPKTKICIIDKCDGHPTLFVVPNSEDKDPNNDFFKSILASKAFWDWFNL